MAITMTDIARELNVSVATVSRALSGDDASVSKEVRSAILQVADRYGYQKRKKLGRTVAFVINKELFNLSSAFYTSIISEIERQVTNRSYYFQFRTVDESRSLLEQVNFNFRDLAGTILVGAYDNVSANRLRELGKPAVLVDFYVPTEDVDSILVDNVDGILRAGAHLAALGHKRVAYVSGVVDRIASQERRTGFSYARQRYGFDADPELIHECSDTIAGAFEAMNEILDSADPYPTAVIAYNDMIAIGVIDAIKRKGIEVPGQISVIGFDDVPLASEVVPGLTTVQVPKEEIGRLAVETLFDRISGGPRPVAKRLVAAKVVVRGSTATLVGKPSTEPPPRQAHE